MKEESSTTTLKENGFDNPYQYTRAIRFKAEVKNQSGCFQERLQLDESQIDISELPNLLLKIHTDLGKLLFFSHKTDDKEDAKNKEPQFNKKLSVSKNWLKNWHRNIFYASIKNKQNKDGKYKLQELKFIYENESFKKWLENWKEKADQLKRYSQQSKESQVRHSDIAYIIRWFLNRQRLSYIQDFLNEAHTPESNLDNQIKSLKSDLEQLQKDLKTAEQTYLSSDSSGIEIAKASFNYYTVNKKSKEYYNEELEEVKRKKYENPSSIITPYKNELIMVIYKKNRMIKCKNDALSVLKKLNELTGNQEKKQKKEIKDQILIFKSSQEKEWFKRYFCKYKINGDLQNGIELSLEQTYHAIKAFKAEQKSIFDEVMKHIASDKKSGSSYINKNENHLLKNYQFDYQNLNQKDIKEIFSLFQFDENGNEYNKFIDLTKNIQDDRNAEKRGKFFQYSFKGYKSLCDQYKSIAQKRGKLIAQIKGIEKEKEEAKQISYWSLVDVEDGHKQLWLIPKDKRQDAKKDINKFAEQNNKLEDSYLCCFESLTMRALHKLCFAEESSFVKEMPEDLRQLQKEAKEMKTDDEDKKVKEQKIQQKNQKELEVFKKVLQWQQELPDRDKRKTLQLKHFNLQATYQSENFEKFEKALESACYYVKKIPLNEEEKQNFIKNHDVTVLDMTSYDLEGRNQNTYQIPHATSENKQHTDLWQMFWKHPDNTDKEASIKWFKIGEVRLNSEVKIRYRKADQKLQKYLENRGFNNEFKKHRKRFTQRNIQDQLTVTLTLALNAGNKYEDLAFSKPEELCEKINDFNEKFNAKKYFKTAWKYGIDRGQIELATLCLTKFEPNKKSYQVNNKAIPKPKFAQIECYTLKDYNHQTPFDDGKQREKTHRKAIDNLSYFIDDKSLFDTKPTSCLDLTTAKVIKEKIVTNGDVMTYLKFKKISAKRKLYELYAEGKINIKTHLKWSDYEDDKQSHHHPEGVLNINIKTDKRDLETTIYHYCDKYKDIISKECIEKDLNRYLDELKNQDERHTPSILQINHLRDAMTANMVGVITHLYRDRKYPGFILLEDLDKGKTKENDNIHNRLEVALYNKFQSLSLVPPHVKDIIQLREDVRKQQQKDNKKTY